MIKLSIIIPSFNRAVLLKQALKSCLNQTVKPFEIIVCDDDSNPVELKKIKKIINKDIKFLQNKKNIGLIATVNKLIKKAKGEYITIVHNDDLLSPNFIEEFEKAILKNIGFNVYASNAMGFRGKNVCGDFRLKERSGIIKKGIGANDLWNRGFYSLITITGPMVYKAKLIKQRLFDIRFGNEADLEMAIYLLARQDIYFFTKPLYYTGLHKAQVSAINKRNDDLLIKYVQNCVRIYEKYEKHFNGVLFYLLRAKSVYFYQLRFKYKKSFEFIKLLLNVGFFEIIFFYIYIPVFIFSEIYKRVMFRVYKPSYRKYFPKGLS